MGDHVINPQVGRIHENSHEFRLNHIFISECISIDPKILSDVKKKKKKEREKGKT